MVVSARASLNGLHRVAADLFNLFDAKVSDIDYFFVSRLPGEPLVPRTLRVALAVGF